MEIRIKTLLKPKFAFNLNIPPLGLLTPASPPSFSMPAGEQLPCFTVRAPALPPGDLLPAWLSSSIASTFQQLGIWRALPQPTEHASSASLLQYHPPGLLAPQPDLRNAGAGGSHPCGMPSAPRSRLAGRAEDGWLVGRGVWPSLSSTSPW